MSRRRGMSNTPTVEIPSWAIDPNRKDGAALAAALALTEHEGKWVRLSAATQRQVLGYPVFGKQAIMAEATAPAGYEHRIGSGGVRVHRTVAFGTDSDQRFYAWDEVTRAAKEGRKL